METIASLNMIWGFPKIGGGTRLGGPHNKDSSILGSILGSLYLGKLPFKDPFLSFLACRRKVVGWHPAMTNDFPLLVLFTRPP